MKKIRNKTNIFKSISEREKEVPLKILQTLNI